MKWEDDNSTTPSRNITVQSNATYTAIVKLQPTIEVGVGETQTFTKPMTVSEFVINADENNSGQVIGAENITLTGPASVPSHVGAPARRTEVF